MLVLSAGNVYELTIGHKRKEIFYNFKMPKIGMPKELLQGYLIYAFFLVKDDPKKWMSNIYDLTNCFCKDSSTLSELRCSTFFGRFDWVVSFKCTSVKIGLNEICNIQSRIRENEILSASSSLVLSQIASNNVTISTCPIECITHIKPIDNIKFVEAIDSYCENEKENDLRVFWNTSGYPFTLVVRGTNYSKIISEVRNFRSQMKKHIAESSMMFNLGYKDNNLIQDEISMVIANVHVKLREFEADNPLKWEGKTLIKTDGAPLDRLAWYDLCYIVEEKSLYDLAKKIIDFKHKNIESVEHTSTLLLGSSGAK